MSPPIFVTGPQRSGTTIAAVIKAADLNLDFIDELDFIIGRNYDNCVIQSPNALEYYLNIHHVYPDSFFFVMNRPRDEIIQSMKRINWLRDDVYDWEAFLNDYVDQKISRCKELLSYLPSQSMQIAYHSLSDHRLFVTDRTEFTSKQWKPGVPRGPKYWANNLQCILQSYERRTEVTAG